MEVEDASPQQIYDLIRRQGKIIDNLKNDKMKLTRDVNRLARMYSELDTENQRLRKKLANAESPKENGTMGHFPQWFAIELNQWKHKLEQKNSIIRDNLEQIRHLSEENVNLSQDTPARTPDGSRDESSPQELDLEHAKELSTKMSELENANETSEVAAQESQRQLQELQDKMEALMGKFDTIERQKHDLERKSVMLSSQLSSAFTIKIQNKKEKMNSPDFDRQRSKTVGRTITTGDSDSDDQERKSLENTVTFDLPDSQKATRPQRGTVGDLVDVKADGQDSEGDVTDESPDNSEQDMDGDPAPDLVEDSDRGDDEDPELDDEDPDLDLVEDSDSHILAQVITGVVCDPPTRSRSSSRSNINSMRSSLARPPRTPSMKTLNEATESDFDDVSEDITDSEEVSDVSSDPDSSTDEDDAVELKHNRSESLMDPLIIENDSVIQPLTRPRSKSHSRTDSLSIPPELILLQDEFMPNKAIPKLPPSFADDPSDDSDEHILASLSFSSFRSNSNVSPPPALKRSHTDVSSRTSSARRRVFSPNPRHVKTYIPEPMQIINDEKSETRRRSVTPTLRRRGLSYRRDVAPSQKIDILDKLFVGAEFEMIDVLEKCCDKDISDHLAAICCALSQTPPFFCHYRNRAVSVLKQRADESEFVYQCIYFIKISAAQEFAELLAPIEAHTRGDPAAVYKQFIERPPKIGFEITLPGHRNVCHPFLPKQVFSIQIKSVFHSKAKPLLLKLICFGKKYTIHNVILKYGDDLRQDVACLSIFRLLNRLWKNDRIKFREHCVEAHVYDCVAMGEDYGCIEYVRNCKALKKLKSMDRFTDTQKRCLVATSAGSYIASWLLGVGDRHDENTLITQDGKLFHIDFAYILGQKVTVDTGEFAITRGLQIAIDPYWDDFVFKCVDAFKCLRHHQDMIIRYAMMVMGHLFTPDRVRDYLNQSLMIDEELEVAQSIIEKCVRSAPKSYKTRFKNLIHATAQARKPQKISSVVRWDELFQTKD